MTPPTQFVPNNPAFRNGRENKLSWIRLSDVLKG